MATQTIRVAAPLVAGSYTVNVQLDGSSTNAYTGRTLSATSIANFWTFTVTGANLGLYAFQILNGSSAVVAYGWFYSASDSTVTIQDSDSRDDALVRNVSLPDIHGDIQSSYTILSNFIDGDGRSDTVFRSWIGLASANLDTQLSLISSGITGIDTVTDRLNTALVQDGAVWQFTANALENTPAQSGSSVFVYPLNASMPVKSTAPLLTFYKDEEGVVIGPVQVSNRNGNTITPVDLSGMTLEVRFVDYEGTELLTVVNADITVSGTDNDQFEFEVTTALTGTVTVGHPDQYHYWSLRDVTTGNNVLLAGRARVLLS